MVGFGIFRIEMQSKKLLENTKSSLFIKSFLSFDSLSSLFILTFFTFCEVFFLVGIVKFSFEYLFKIRNPEYLFTSINSHYFIYSSVLIWILLLYVKLFFDRTRLGWLKGLRFFVFIVALGLISLIFYKPVYFIEYINAIVDEMNTTSRFFLRPQTIWDLKVWQNSAGKSFIIIVFAYYLFKIWKSQINTSSLGLISLTILFSALGSTIVYFLPRFAARLSDLANLNNSSLMYALCVISIILIITLLLVNRLTSILFEQNTKHKYHLHFEESKYLTKQNVLFILILFVGLASGILFIVVGFKDYSYWLGMIFLFLLVLNFAIHFITSFSFNKVSKRFDDRNTESKLTSTDKLVLRFVLPSILIPLFLLSLPDYLSNFLGNKLLTKKIEYLQDLGRITSNHHSLEPYIVRDYNKIILDIDSNKVQLDKIDTLNSMQKDSIQFYLENRNYKMNESFRIKKLQFHHDVVFIKNICKWSLILLALSIFLLYRFKIRDI
jgi:hypothetical protein